MTRWISLVALSAIATGAQAQAQGAPDVDFKLAAQYCEAAQPNRDEIDTAALSACMRDFGYSRIRFGAGTRF